MSVDVCLIAEGTYPFVTGGVAGWTHDLIRGLPDVSFAVLHLAARADEPRVAHYDRPPNLVDVVTVALHGGDEPPGEDGTLPPSFEADVLRFHERMHGNDFGGLGDLARTLAPPDGAPVSGHELLYGRRGFELVRTLYERRAPDAPFADYFWTWRFMHVPIFRLLRAPMPDAAVYHTISTGWAGLAGALARGRHRRPLLLTEHGIYARERRLDIADADWIFTERPAPATLGFGTTPFLKSMWIRFFRRLAQLTYAEADVIVTLFEGNRRAQLADGADPARTLIVPNGIDVERLAALPRVPAGEGELRIGLVGRVVPIKDVKTFLRAFRIVADRLPRATALVVGPLDEDPGYAAECCALATTLGLGDRLRFTGRADVRDIYPRLDVLALTSVSEGLPLVVLEAMAAGIPVVATDVGACRELLEGRDEPDRSLGPSGVVTRRADPTATADALLALAREPARARQLGRAGQARVRAHYRAGDVLAQYRRIYDQLARASARAR